MACKRQSKQIIQLDSESEGTADDGFTRSRSVDELSDDADLLEINESIFISSHEGKEGQQKAEEEDRDCCVETVHVVRNGANEGKRKRKNINFTMPVGWRTRSFTKNDKRVDYTTYYKKNDSDSEESSEFEESDLHKHKGVETPANSSDCSLDSDSDKNGWLPKEKKKSRNYNTVHVNGSAYSLGKCKGTGIHKGVETPVSSSDCSLDSDDVPILERLHKKRKHNPNEEGCSWAPFEEVTAVSISSEDDEEMVRKVRKVGKRKRVTKRRRSCEIPDEELFDFYMRNSDADSEEVPESSQNHIPRELPMVFNFGSDDEPPVEKSEFERLTDEAWDDYDFALGVKDLGSYKPNEDIARKDAVYIATGNYCSNGEHEMYLDEQIGYKCRHCSYVETEIRYIFPDFATQVKKAPAGRTDMNDNDIFRYEDLQEKTEINDKPESSFRKTGTVWDLIPGLIDTLYPHQKEAFEFMWQTLVGSTQLDNLHSVASKSGKHGCVISHAPGTGKTRLAIVFIQSYMKAFPDCHPVVVAPANLLKTWDTEFKKWGFNLPFHNMNSEDLPCEEDKGNRMRRVHTKKLVSWSKRNSVLGISYPLFNNYVSGNACSRERDALIDKPGLLILDEGHTPRNDKGQLWNALSKVKTEKRIILSGTPFQNNFSELYNTLCLVSPKFVKNSSVQTETPNKKESLFHKKKEKPGKDIWTTPTRNVTAANAEEVRAVLKPFVHVYTGEILKSLPGLIECVIVLNPEAAQGEVIRKLGQAWASEEQKNINQRRGFFLDRECKISLASIHPSLLFNKLNKIEASFLDRDQLKKLHDDPYAGVKTKFVIEFIRLINSNATKERVLIFSKYIIPLELIKEQLKRVFQWTEGTEVFRICGLTTTKDRERSIASFNDANSKARVLLANTRACSEGISLIGASRVVLLDVVWNPSVSKQAISRAFRIGQERVVYTYNLITAGTDEMKKYDVQMQKDKLSKLVFSPKDIGTSLQRGCASGDGDMHDSMPEDMVLQAIRSSEQLKGMFAKIYYAKSDDWSDLHQVNLASMP
ncbi:SNF2 domain-containing protein CLASSY 3-like protein [Carex littledalei]|uniref:SNF2 domain-containing protein CLASSY 3-like protein n=1 Tax=Carex littledalei TaxID=544730 RepID=A0A833RTE0_9POAL|nr:SNF2 domain-containing protein CLASSY 3-like protein [Carex littledalei]